MKWMRDMGRRLVSSAGLRSLRLFVGYVLVAGLYLAHALLSAPVAHAAGFSVTDCSSYGTSAQAGTLAKALADATVSANDSDIITFGCDTSGAGIVFPSEYSVDKGLTIDATGHTVTFNGGDKTRFFYLNKQTGFGPGALTLKHLTLAHGFTTSAGGAIAMIRGSLTISDSVLSDNVFLSGQFNSGGGGAIYDFGGRVTITNTSFARNQARVVSNNGYRAHGGAIYIFASANEPPGSSTFTISGSTFNDNSVSSAPTVNQGASADGGAIFVEMYCACQPKPSFALSITNSAFSRNTSSGTAGAIKTSGVSLALSGATFNANTANDIGAVTVENGALSVDASAFLNNRSKGSAGAMGLAQDVNGTITRSLFSGNNATQQGGALRFAGALIVSNSTFTGNSLTAPTASSGDDGGGAIYSAGSLTLLNDTLARNSIPLTESGSNVTARGFVSIKNTIIANEVGSADCSFSMPGAQDGGYNLDSGSSCGFDTVIHSLSNTDPRLGPLANNGGPTQTMALLSDSPARDAGNDSVCATAPVGGVDQRGAKRAQGAACDIGAFEADPSTAASPATTASASATTTTMAGTSPTTQSGGGFPFQPVIGGLLALLALGGGAAFLLVRWRKVQTGQTGQAGQGDPASPTMTRSEGTSDWFKDGPNN